MKLDPSVFDDIQAKANESARELEEARRLHQVFLVERERQIREAEERREREARENLEQQRERERAERERANYNHYRNQ